MKTVYEIFDENFQGIIDDIKNDNLRGSTYISTDLIKIADLIDFQDGVFIGEVLEAIFNQIESEFAQFKVSNEDKESLKTALISGMTEISMVYKNNDKNELYKTLSNMRSHATRFQFYCRQKCELLARSRSLDIKL